MALLCLVMLCCVLLCVVLTCFVLAGFVLVEGGDRVHIIQNISPMIDTSRASLDLDSVAGLGNRKPRFRHLSCWCKSPSSCKVTSVRFVYADAFADGSRVTMSISM